MKSSHISQQIKVQRNTDMVTGRIDNEVVMMSIENGEYYGLDEIGSRIWELMGEPIRVEDLIRRLTDEFDVDFEVCKTDTINFLNELSSKGLLKIFK